MSENKIIRYYLELNMQAGLLKSKYLIKDQQNRETEILSHCIVHMKIPHTAAQQFSITPKNYSETIEIKTAIECANTKTGFSIEKLDNLKEQLGIYLLAKKTKPAQEVVLASRTEIFSNNQKLDAAPKNNKLKTEL